MHINFKENNIVEIDDARIIFRNFSGTASKFNAAGNRNFSVIIPNQEIADALMGDKNQYGVGWNVRIKPAREDGDAPFMHLPVKIKFSGRGPNIYLKTNGRMTRLNEDTIGMLDDIDIRSVALDIRPYDDMGQTGPFRAAYLQSMCVTQEVDRFAARFAEEEAPEEMPFEI